MDLLGRWRHGNRVIASAPTRALLSSVLSGLVVVAGLGWLTVDHVVTRVDLARTGVPADALVTDVVRASSRARGSGPVLTMRVVPEVEQRFSTTLYHWPRGTSVGDHVGIVFDPRNPARAYAVGEPLLDVRSAVVVVVAVLVGASTVVRLRELTRRRGGRRKVEPGPRAPTWLEQQPRARAVWTFVVVPFMVTAQLGVLTALRVHDAEELARDGVPGVAIVRGVAWERLGWSELQVQFPRTSRFVTVAEWDGVPLQGDPLAVRYLPDRSATVVQDGTPRYGRRTLHVVAATTVAAGVTAWGGAAVGRVARHRRRERLDAFRGA